MLSDILLQYFLRISLVLFLRKAPVVNNKCLALLVKICLSWLIGSLRHLLMAKPAILLLINNLIIWLVQHWIVRYLSSHVVARKDHWVVDVKLCVDEWLDLSHLMVLLIVVMVPHALSHGFIAAWVVLGEGDVLVFYTGTYRLRLCSHPKLFFILVEIITEIDINRTVWSLTYLSIHVLIYCILWHFLIHFPLLIITSFAF